MAQYPDVSGAEVEQFCHQDHALAGAVEAALADCGYVYDVEGDTWHVEKAG